MAAPGKLSALSASRARVAGMYGDGGGLWLQVSGAGAKSWIFRFTLNGRSREMGLGSFSTFTLAEAREKALACRKLCAEGIDPIQARQVRRGEAQLEAAKAMTFRECALAYIESHKAGWRNARHASQWPTTLEGYVYPVFGDLPVQAVDTGLVMKAIEPIWATKSETASRLRGRIESVLDWATTRGYRRGENPARWKGHLQNLLPKRSKVRRVAHHAALPYSEMASFMAELRTREVVVARALEFTILTAARTGEAMGARWVEIDLSAAMWTIPAERMKGGREHRVPLSAAAVDLLKVLPGPSAGEFVFPGGHGKPLPKTSMLELLKQVQRLDVTVHGFRSTFRDWAAETTNFPSDVVEMALAHAVSDKVEAAYRRGDLFAKRRELMDAWAQHIRGRP
ncbi:integrase [Methylobacterium sp. Leaf117]|nr:integrase [Methylobacterium sp. Leaf117]